jgi:hypothetical protein
MVLRADCRAAAASRWMSAAIGALCLAIAASGLARLGLPNLDRSLAMYAPLIGAATLIVIFAAYRKAALR